MKIRIWYEQVWMTGQCVDLEFVRSKFRRAFEGTFYTLSFTYVFAMANDTVFFAYYYPFTYTMHREFVGRILGHRTACRICADHREEIPATARRANRPAERVEPQPSATSAQARA